MASKNDLKAELAGVMAARDMLLRDNEAYRGRELKRMRADLVEEQTKLKEAERKERDERIENIGAGLLPLKGATQWAIVHEEGGRPGVEVFVPLSETEQRAVQDFLNGLSRGNGRIGGHVIDGLLQKMWPAPVINPGAMFVNGGIF